MKRFIRFVALSLTVIIACASLCGCFGGGKKGPEKQILDKVYKYKTTELVSMEEPQYDNIEEFNGQTYIGHTSLDGSGYVYTLQTIDKDYKTESLVAYVGTEDGESAAIPLSVYDGKDGYRNVQNFSRMPDGLVVGVSESKLVDEENYIYDSNFYAEIYGLDGMLKNTVDLQKALGIDTNNSYFGLITLVYAAGDLLATVYTENDEYNNKIIRISLDGEIKDVIPLLPEGTDGYASNVFVLGDNKICVPVETYGEEFKQTVAIIDLTSGERTEYDVGDNYEIMYNMFVGEDGGIYYSNDEGIYSFDVSNGESEQIVNFINSDYIYKYGRFSAVNSEKFMTVSDEYEDNKHSLMLTVFEKVPKEEITPKYLIKVASAGGAYSLREQIVEFNLASEDYRIQYIDYSQYNTDEDYEAGKNKLNNDIIAGNIPDVLIADEDFSAAKYVNKGLFVDLYTLMDSDATFTRDKFLGNILSACEVNGKLYEIPTSIYLAGFIGIKDKISEFDGLTMPQFLEKSKALPEGVTFLRDGDYSRNDLLRILFSANYTNYLNSATGRCSLNNADFKAMLEWLATQPEKAMWEKEDFDYDNFDYEAYENTFKEGKAIASWSTLDSFESLTNYTYSYGDAELEFIGVPAPDGDGMAFTATNLKFLVSAKGNFPKEAWEFVKVFFTDENQRELGWGFPVTKSALDLAKQETLDRIAENEKSESEQGEGGAMIKPGMIGGDFIRPIYRTATREQVEQIYGYLTTVKKELRYDESVLDIVKEEASEYFGGKKSLDDVAYQAESRVNIKLGEQY